MSLCSGLTGAMQFAEVGEAELAVAFSVDF